MSTSVEWNAIDESALKGLAGGFASLLRQGGVVLLEGDLGAGKTTFARALLKALGVGERIKSPTYSLLESYLVGDLRAHHLDLYRIADADELEWLGLPDLLEPNSLILIEWPERGAGALPPADLRFCFAHAGERRNVSVGAYTARGRQLIARFGAGPTDATPE